MVLLFEQHLAAWSQLQLLPQGWQAKDMELRARVMGELSLVGSTDKKDARSSHQVPQAATQVLLELSS